MLNMLTYGTSVQEAIDNPRYITQNDVYLTIIAMSRKLTKI